MRRWIVFLCVLITIGVVVSQWKPVRSITIIVPWAAGGATDQVTRMTASLMEPDLGKKFIIVNTPGGAGSIGTLNAWQAPHDGYTWTANSVMSIASYPVLGYLKVTHRDWKYLLPVYNPNVVVVNPNTPYKSVQDLVEALRKNPDIPLSSAGTGSGGHIALEHFASYFGVKYKHVPYAGGAPATTAVVAGEVVGNMQFSNEVADMIRAGKLRALCTLGAEPLELDGYGTIPSIRQWYPDFPECATYFGIMIPADVPTEVLEAVYKIFEKAAKSEEFNRWAIKQGLVPVCIYGDEADRVVEKVVVRDLWLLYDRGIATISPLEFGIQRP